AEDALAEVVAGTGKRERGVRVEALEASGTGRAADSAGKLRPELALFGVRPVEASLERWVVVHRPRPLFDPSRPPPPPNLRPAPPAANSKPRAADTSGSTLAEKARRWRHEATAR